MPRTAPNSLETRSHFLRSAYTRLGFHFLQSLTPVRVRYYHRTSPTAVWHAFALYLGIVSAGGARTKEYASFIHKA